MNYSWLLFILIILYCYTYISDKRISIGLVIGLIMKILYDIGLFQKINFEKGIIHDKIIYFREYLGNIQEIQSEIKKLKNILKKFDLENDKQYAVFAIYYDEVNQRGQRIQRTLVGITKNIKAGYDQEEIKGCKHFEEYLYENQYFKSNIPKTNTLNVNFDLDSDFSWFFATKKFYKALINNIKSEEFHDKFNSHVLKQANFPVLEVYRKDTIQFYIPLNNMDRFTIDSLNINKE